MSGPGGKYTVRFGAALAGILLAGGMGGCAYEDDGGTQPTATGQSHRPAPTVSAKEPEILDVEASNFDELHRHLARASGALLLADDGPADGPEVGFRKVATVMTAGPYTVTAACVGIPHAQIYLSQDTKAGTEHMVFEVDCSGAQTQVVQLQKGYVSAQVIRQDPTGPWTGAVAGIKITAR